MTENLDGRRGGRPAGPSAKTVLDGAVFSALQKFGHSPEQIAAGCGTSRSWVYDAIKAHKTQADAPGPRLVPDAGDDPDALPAPQPPRRVGAKTVKANASTACRSDRVLRGLPDGVRLAWLDLIDEIHLWGDDGVELRFEKPGRHHSMEKFADSFGLTVDDVRTLIDLALLVELPGGGVAMPMQFDLRPKAPRARSRVRQASAPARAQATILYPISGGLDGAAEGGNPRTDLSSVHREKPDSPADFSEQSPDSNPDAHAAAAALKTEDSLESSSSSKQARAPESGVAGQFPDSTESRVHRPTPDSDPLAALMADLVTAGRRGGKFTGHERETLRTWAGAGIPPEFVKPAIVAKLAKQRRTEGDKWLPSSLAYFKEPVLEAWAEERARSPAATNGHAEPASQRSGPDWELSRRFTKAAIMRGRHSSAPMGPVSCDRLKETGEIGTCWLDDVERWEAGGFAGERPADLVKYVAAYKAAAP